MSAPAVWGYICVSGDERADPGLPVAGHCSAIEEWAKEHGLHPTRALVDGARWGGAKEREEFKLSGSMALVPCSTSVRNNLCALADPSSASRTSWREGTSYRRWCARLGRVSVVAHIQGSSGTRTLRPARGLLDLDNLETGF